jgi:hypothetical protein
MTLAPARRSGFRLQFVLTHWPCAPCSLSEERDTLCRRFPDVTNRALIVKVNRSLRF